MTNRPNEFSAVWEVVLADGSTWTPADSRPGPTASHIYARSTADAFAAELGGTVRQVLNADGTPKNGAR